MLTGYFPFWGASVVIYFANAEPVLFIPTIELPDGLPQAGVRVRQYPWGEVKCTDPFGVLIAGLTEELAKAGVKREKTGMNPSSARISLPMFTGEQIPMAEDFSQHLSKIASVPSAECLAGFAALYQRKSAEEVENHPPRQSRGQYRPAGVYG